MSGEGFVGVAALSTRLDISSVTLWRWCKAGTFPQPVYFQNRRRWRVSEVDAWIASQINRPDSRHGAPPLPQSPEPLHSFTERLAEHQSSLTRESHQS